MSGGGEKAAWAAVIVTAGAAALYGVGWVYATHWFELFGLGAVGLDIPKETFFIWGAQAFMARLIPVLMVCIAAAAAVALWRLWLRSRVPAAGAPYLPYLGWGVGAPLTFYLLLWALHVLAISVAAQDVAAERQSGFDTRPRVTVQFAANPPPAGADKLNEGCHRLLLRAKDALLLVRPRLDEPDLTLETTIIPTAQIALWKATPTPGPCP